MVAVTEKFDGTKLFTDWAGRDISEGDYVVWAPGERYERGLPYGKIVSITVYEDYSRYDYVKKGKVTFVRVKVQKADTLTTIDSRLHPYAYHSLTKFVTVDDSVRVR